MLAQLDAHAQGLLDVPAAAAIESSSEAETPVEGDSLIGTRPTLYITDKDTPGELFEVKGNDVRIQRLHMQGPKLAAEHATVTASIHGMTVYENAEPDADPVVGAGRRMAISDNEFDQWSASAVRVAGSRSDNQDLPALPEDWDSSWKHLYPPDAGLVVVDRNYLHHNVMDGRGYGVNVTTGAYVTVEGNVFDTSRHAIAGSGKAYSGYVARFNYVFYGGTKEDGDYHNQHFDMHGTGDGGYGGYAGEYVFIRNNTFHGDQGYRCDPFCLTARPAFMLRGRKAQGAWFNDNVLVHDDLDPAVSLKMEKNDTGWGEDHEAHNFHATGNKFDVDYSAEIATGDFDGDGRDDIAVGNSSEWKYSARGTADVAGQCVDVGPGAGGAEHRLQQLHVLRQEDLRVPPQQLDRRKAQLMEAPRPHSLHATDEVSAAASRSPAVATG